MMRFACFLICGIIGTFALSACGPKPEGAHSSTVKVSSSETVNGAVTKATGVKVTGAYIKPVLGKGTATAAYVTIENTGISDDRLTSVSCDCAEMATLHTMAMKGDMMTMGEATEGFVVAPKQTLSLAPGGNHIMLMGLKAAPAVGSQQKLTLHFEKAGNIALDVPVQVMP
jgi:periplasmic copper chaperone A